MRLMLSAGVMSGMLEPFGVPLTGMINSISYSLWALWTLIFRVVVYRSAAVLIGERA
jgi:ABC-type thiamin/hydroxymethylpyrimidine transport system permease subunit